MRFAGHETFAVRDGWLSKGLNLLAEPDAPDFATIAAADRLGVGKNMAKAIRHWLIATGLAAKPARGQSLVRTALGEFVASRDPAMLEPATWWALQANLVAQRESALVWSWFFDSLERDRFDRLDLVDRMARFASIRESRPPSRDTVSRDVLCLLASYAEPVPAPRDDPEDGAECPFRELGLLSHYEQSGTYRVHRGDKPIPPGAFGYALAQRFGARKATADIPLSTALADAGAPGRAFLLDGDALDARLEHTESALGDHLATTMLAGERVIRLGPCDPLDLLAHAFTPEAAHA